MPSNKKETKKAVAKPKTINTFLERKFRVRYTDPTYGLMTVPVIGLVFSEDGVHAETNAGDVFIPKAPKTGEAELLQFTGLYDETKWSELSEEEKKVERDSGMTPKKWKGKEIWEGDVIQWGFAGNTLTGVIAFSKYVCAFVVLSKRTDEDGYMLVSTRHWVKLGILPDFPEINK